MDLLRERRELNQGLGDAFATAFEFAAVTAIFLGIGVSLLLLSGLRALQTETGTTFTGNWSWAPYLIAVAVGLVMILLAVLRVSRRKGPEA